MGDGPAEAFYDRHHFCAKKIMMMVKLSEAYSKLAAFARSRGRLFGYLLSLAAFAYLAILLIFGGIQLQSIHWAVFIFPGLGALIIHLLSSLIQYFVWTRLLTDHHQSGWQDMAIYSRVLMLRRLPGGVWHWVGRTAMYAESTKVPAKVAGMANFVEWALLILTAGCIASLGIPFLPAGIRFTLGALLLLAAIWIGSSWQSGVSLWRTRIVRTLTWILIYWIAWCLGGVVIYWFANTTKVLGAMGGAELNLATATWIWALGGGGSMILVFVPSGLGIRELSLIWLLQPYLPPIGAVTVALLLRFVYTVGDFLWGSLGWYLSNRALKKREIPSKTSIK